MKQLTLIAAFLIAISPSARSQESKDCYTIEHQVRATITALQNHDTDGYAKLADHDKMMTYLRSNMVTDTTKKNIYEALNNRPEVPSMVFEASFTNFSKKIADHLETDKWDIKLKNYKIEHIEKEDIIEHLTLTVDVDANGKGLHFTMYATKYKGCYYLFEPLEPRISEN